MKKLLLSSSIMLAFFGANAQEADSVSLEPGYIKQSYYSIENGEMASVTLASWDLAFDVSSWGSAVRINATKYELYLSTTDTADFGSPLDTAGIDGWDSYLNSDVSWGSGAFNGPADGGDATDLGWGHYSTITHHTVGDRVFVLKDIASNECHKIWIQLLASGTFTFRVASLDNTDDDVYTVVKSDFTNKNFGYFYLTAGTTLDLEPNNETWDIIFTKYVTELAPGVSYGVTGVLSNASVMTQKIDDLPVADANYVEGASIDEINVIGYDWKYFDMGSFSFMLEDSTSFFVESFSGDVWKLWFTSFEGSSSGKVVFNKQLVGAAGNPEFDFGYSVYPNPAKDILNITSENGAPIENIVIYDLSGKVVYSETITSGSDFITISTNDLIQGTYIVQIVNSNGAAETQKIQVIH
ncbi:MAG: T9SS type A sorting domain-containing protein [Crocinitomicaceae bacterium]|nr:T9SS type A sorting domain-containing protein [Crocinitomicaceae bacterium]